MLIIKLLITQGVKGLPRLGTVLPAIWQAVFQPQMVYPTSIRHKLTATTFSLLHTPGTYPVFLS
ncbi:TPA: hypothetical protein ACXR7L_004150, partial [Yersinia enterocolitica]